jgi:ubiquinol-cytochrome c reductase cytochrome b subunit
MAKAGGFFFIVVGVTALMSALFTINPIWAYGTYDPSPISAGAQPDWYMGFLDGAVRLMPGFLEVTFLGFTLSLNIAIAALIIPGLITTPMILYPWIEAWVTGDHSEHHLLDRPRNVPTRTGLGAMAITFYILLWISGGNDIVATHMGLSINDITRSLRVLCVVLPPLAYLVVKRAALGMQRKDREKVLHGRETGRVFRTEGGEVFELHEPLDAYARWTLVQHSPSRPIELPAATDARGVRRPGSRLDRVRRRVASFYFEDRVEPVTPGELAAAHHGDHGSDDGQAAVESGSEERLVGAPGD